MPLSGPKAELRRLTRFVGELEKRYLAPHLTPTSLGPPSRNEVLDVAAFVVLAHGALEDFAEGLTIWIAGRVQSNWIRKRRVSRSTAALLLRTKFDGDDETSTDTAFDTIRRSMERAKTERSSAANANNGVAPKHFRSLLAPLGLDIPGDATLIASLDSFVNMRHEWAHQSRSGAKTSRGASDVKKLADDCLAFAQQLVSRAIALRL